MNMKELGTFKVNTHEIKASDPCYSVGPWCQGVLKPVVKGDWRAFAEYGVGGSAEGRVALLRIVHEAASPHIECDETADFEVGVDSGTAGFWDIIAYRNRQLLEDKFKNGADDDHWFNMCHTIYGEGRDDSLAYVGPFGVHSSSGYGDGSYQCKFARNAQGLIVAAEIDFFQRELDEDSDEE